MYIYFKKCDSNSGGPKDDNFGMVNNLKNNTGYQKLNDNDNDNDNNNNPNINISTIQNGSNSTIIYYITINNYNNNTNYNDNT